MISARTKAALATSTKQLGNSDNLSIEAAATGRKLGRDAQKDKGYTTARGKAGELSAQAVKNVLARAKIFA